MSKGRRNTLAGQVGEYLVCAELGRRGYVAAPFAGNVPTFDVIATDAQCRSVPIQVKATRGNSWPTDASWWMDLRFDHHTGRQRSNGPLSIQHPDLIYVCVAIAKEGGRDRFFVLTRLELQQVCLRGYGEYMDRHGWVRPRNPRSTRHRYGIHRLEPHYEDRWELITDRLSPASEAREEEREEEDREKEAREDQTLDRP